MRYYKSGDWNAECAVCGGMFKASQLRKTWDGYYTCERDWYPRNPQDFPVQLKEVLSPPFTRPYGQDTNTDGNPITSSGILQFVNGIAISPPIPSITATSNVIVKPSLIDGPHGTWTATITPGVGFTVTTTQILENSTFAYTVNEGGCVSRTSLAGYAVVGCMVCGWEGDIIG